MASFTLEEAPVYEVIPEDAILEAEIVECVDKETPFDLDKKDPSLGKQHQISFKFVVREDGDFNGRILFGNTPTWFTNHPNCKLRIWAQEILGIDSFPIGFEFDTEDLVGLPVKVTVGHRVKVGGNADGTDQIKLFVKDVQRVGSMDFADDVF